MNKILLILLLLAGANISYLLYIWMIGEEFKNNYRKSIIFSIALVLMLIFENLAVAIILGCAAFAIEIILSIFEDKNDINGGKK